jgi:hypothetical protein
MEVIFSVILFLAAFLPGIIILSLKKPLKLDLKYLLVFAGSFIFSITIVHLLPELFTASANPGRIGLFVLVGFFMQIFLNFMTTGVEHGHLHMHEDQSSFSPIMLMIGLCVHALMDGSILVHSGNPGMDEHGTGLLVGIVLHKIPAAIALVSVLNASYQNKNVLIGMLLVFSLASPAGLLFSEILSQNNYLGREGFIIVFAIVSGNFLHISTTIYFETSPKHTFHKKKLFISLLGAIMAILVEVLNH